MRNFFLWTIGCQYNVHDGIRVGYLLNRLGFIESPAEEANFIIILACAVRQTAVDRILGKLRDWKGKKIIVSGCVLPADRKKLAAAGVLFWNIEKPQDLADILSIKDKRQIKALFQEGAKLSSYVPIMVGCNNFCSYCAVPYTRGRERSRPMEEVIRDVKSIIRTKAPTPRLRTSGDRSSGLRPREIMLLGQNVNSYKISQKSKVESQKCKLKAKTESDFTKLLKALNNLEGDFAISFISNHPKDMEDDIIKAVATLPKIKKSIHLPLQSGSNKILKAMNRPYTKEQYLKIVEKIRRADSKIEITTDVIVGFPGETEVDFQQTVEAFKKVGYALAYINKYSPRAGTAAFKLGDPISWDEKKRRWKILNELANHKN